MMKLWYNCYVMITARFTNLHLALPRQISYKFNQGCTSKAFQRSPQRYHTIQQTCYSSTTLYGRTFQQRIRYGMTIAECRPAIHELFNECFVSEPILSADYLIAHVLGYKTLSNVSLDRKITEEDAKRLLPLIALRLRRLPIQYVIREWDFRNLTLHLKPPVLIPRPETEELVELIVTQKSLPPKSHFLEVGPGSGAICCSVLSECPQMTCDAVDVSQDACELTKINAENVGVTDRLRIYNLALNEYTADCSTRKYDFLVSNPPYIPSSNMLNLQPEIAWHEDPVALDGGKDGLDIIRDILHVAPKIVEHGGRVWLEVDSSQPEIIRDIVAPPNSGLRYCATHKDFNQMLRFCELQVECIL